MQHLVVWTCLHGFNINDYTVNSLIQQNHFFVHHEHVGEGTCSLESDVVIDLKMLQLIE